MSTKDPREDFGEAFPGGLATFFFCRFCFSWSRMHRKRRKFVFTFFYTSSPRSAHTDTAHPRPPRTAPSFPFLRPPCPPSSSLLVLGRLQCCVYIVHLSCVSGYHVSVCAHQASCEIKAPLPICTIQGCLR